MKRKKIITSLLIIFGLSLSSPSLATTNVYPLSIILNHHPKFRSLQAKNVEIVRKKFVREKKQLSASKQIKMKNLNSKLDFNFFNFESFSPSSGFNFPSFNSTFSYNNNGYASGVLGEELKGNKYAIIIGISNYPGTTIDLKYADDDAYIVKEILESQYNFPSENIFSFIDEGTGANNSQPTQATAQNIFNKINELKEKLGPEDELIFFFSGHGARGQANDRDSEFVDEAIVVHDGQNNIYIWDGQLRDWFSDFPTDRIVFIFDSCLSGGMTDLSAPGRIINMATQEFGFYDSAVELDNLGHGEFTYYFFIKAIKEKLGDVTPTDGLVSCEEAFDYANNNSIYDKPSIIDYFENDLYF